MLDNERIAALFNKDKAHFAHIKYALDSGAKVIYAEEDGLFMKYAGCDIYCSYGLKAGEEKRILSLEKGVKLIVCSSAREARAALKVFSLGTARKCYQVLYEKTVGAKPPADTVVERLLPTDENVDLVTETYTLGYDRESIKQAIKERGMYAAITGGKISAYIGTHEEGAIGMLEVMPEFRGRGLGSFMVNYMVGKLL